MLDLIFILIVLAAIAFMVIAIIRIEQRCFSTQDKPIIKQEAPLEQDKPIIKQEAPLEQDKPYIILEKVTIRTGGDTGA